METLEAEAGWRRTVRNGSQTRDFPTAFHCSWSSRVVGGSFSDCSLSLAGQVYSTGPDYSKSWDCMGDCDLCSKLVLAVQPGFKYQKCLPIASSYSCEIDWEVIN